MKRPIFTSVIVVAALLGGILTIFEPLWIDELHTLWVCDGPLEDLAAKALQGNQSPLWYWSEAVFLRAIRSIVDEQVISTTVLIRLPSLFAWLGTFLIIGNWIISKTDAKSTVATVSVAGCIAILLWCDQLNWFYSVEARPYSAVALACVIAAWLVISDLSMRLLSGRLEIGCNVLFVIACVVAVYLHYTAVIFVAAMFLIRTLYWLIQINPKTNTVIQSSDSKSGRELLFELILFSVMLAPILLPLLEIGARRENWQSFAGQAGFFSVWALMPLGAWVLVPSATKFIESRLSKSKPQISDQQMPIFESELIFIVLVASATVGLAWLLTATGIAPLMHSRYVIGAYPLIVVAAGILFASIDLLALRMLACGASAMTWMLIQGGPHLLRDGSLIVWQRHENWPAIIRQAESKTTPNTEIFLSPMLVETRDMLTMEKHRTDYLQFPLQAAKKLVVLKSRSLDSAIAKARILPNSTAVWPAYFIPKDDDPTTQMREILLIVRAFNWKTDDQILNFLPAYLSAKLSDRELVWTSERLYGQGRLAVYRLTVKPVRREP